MDDAARDVRIRAMVVRRYSRQRIAAEVGLTLDELRAAIARIWRTNYHAQVAATGRMPQERLAELTPEEIAERAAEVRLGWSETEHRRRAGLPESTGWEAPTVSVRGS
jgi:hypothetical protein